MKQTVKTSRTAGLLEKMFRALNVNYFNSELEEPIITIQSTPKAYGHVTVGRAWRKGQEKRHELNIGAGTLDRPIEDITATLLHEMVHLWNIHENIQDCSRGGQYHNKRFREVAEVCDLKISYDKRIGWSITEPTAPLCDFIIEQGWTDINMSRVEWACAGPSTGKKPTVGGVSSSTRKYICPKCGMSVRATKDVRIKCMDCDLRMILQ